MSLNNQLYTINLVNPKQVNLQILPPLSLYIHFPWCIRKCPYCDFNSHQVKNEGIPERLYLNALIADLDQALPDIWGRSIISIFFGGGTPSLISAAGFDWLMSQLRARLHFDPNIEITLEANPGAVDVSRLNEYHLSGVNRLSLGIQSFNSKHLQALGRIHDSEQAKQAVYAAQQIFSNYNLDLMYALPEQKLEDCETDLTTALAFNPPHLSLYHLTLEPNTYFHRYPPKLPNDDDAAEMQQFIQEKMIGNAYKNYEISAFAKAKNQCKHNLNYWTFGDYLGIGAGAHSKISLIGPNHFSSHSKIIRMLRWKHPETYIKNSLQKMACQEIEEVLAEDLPFEYMLNVLRLKDGFMINDFTAKTGLPSQCLTKNLNNAIERGLLHENEGGHYSPTELGQRFLNDLQMIFLNTANPSSKKIISKQQPLTIANNQITIDS